MKILQIIHLFYPYSVGGSEIYAYNLAKGLSTNNDVYVFTTITDKKKENYIYEDIVHEGINIRMVWKNVILNKVEDILIDDKIDFILEEYINKIKPDIIHFQHIANLSHSIITTIKKKFNIPIIFTTHDFYLSCIKGIYFNESTMSNCNEINKNLCYQCLSGLIRKKISPISYSKFWEERNIIRKSVDMYISPSMFLRNFYILNGVKDNRIKYLKNGFNLEQIQFRTKKYMKHSVINFGFIGRIIPLKGLDILLRAFYDLNKNSNLYIYGDAKDYKIEAKYKKTENIHFMGFINNENLNEAFSKIDVLVVPSIWYENSPLVIQEAFMAGIPVITSNIGGMKELIQDKKNGFTFNAGNFIHLREILTKICSNPEILNQITPSISKVMPMHEHINKLTGIYLDVMKLCQ